MDYYWHLQYNYEKKNNHELFAFRGYAASLKQYHPGFIIYTKKALHMQESLTPVNKKSIAWFHSRQLKIGPLWYTVYLCNDGREMIHKKGIDFHLQWYAILILYSVFLTYTVILSGRNDNTTKVKWKTIFTTS